MASTQDEELPVVPSNASDSEDDEFELSEYDKIRPPRRMPPDASVLLTPQMLSEFKCPICLDLLSQTLTTKECLHRFCEECITAALRRGNKECPTCRKKLVSRRSLRQDTNFDKLIQAVFPNRKVFDQIENLSMGGTENQQKNEEKMPEIRKNDEQRILNSQHMNVEDAESTEVGWMWQEGTRPYRIRGNRKWQKEWAEEDEMVDDEKTKTEYRMGTTREECASANADETDEESLEDELEDLEEQLKQMDDDAVRELRRLEQLDEDVESVCSSSDDDSMFSDDSDSSSSDIEMSNDDELVQFDVPFASTQTVQNLLAPFNNSAIIVPDYLLTDTNNSINEN